MIVDIAPFIVTEYASKKEVDGCHYKIMVEGHFCGLLPYHDGAKIMLHKRFNPLQLKEIERTVRRYVTPQRLGGIVQVPLPREEPKKRTATSNREDFG